MKDAGESPAESEPREPGVHFDTRPPQMSLWRRMQIPLIAGVVYGVVRALGPTLRYEVLGWHHAEQVYARHQQCIWTFWHRAIFGILWWGRNHGVVVLHSANFDGRWAGEVAHWMGFGVAQGSTTRGGLRGLAVMEQRLQEGLDVAFTVDGPRGPRFVAKPGPIMLARSSGSPVLAFYVGLQRARTFQKAWDHFQLPLPFSRAVILIAPPIHVPADADRETVERKHAELQRELDRLREIGDAWFTMPEEERRRHRAGFGSSEFTNRPKQ